MPERLRVDDEPRYECTSGPCTAGLLGVFPFGQVAAPGLGLYVGSVENEWTLQSDAFVFVLLMRPLRDSSSLPAGVVGRA